MRNDLPPEHQPPTDLPERIADPLAEVRRQAAAVRASGAQSTLAGTNTTSVRHFDVNAPRRVVRRDGLGRLTIDWSAVGEGDDS
jgi:hypothetical protein